MLRDQRTVPQFICTALFKRIYKAGIIIPTWIISYRSGVQNETKGVEVFAYPRISSLSPGKGGDTRVRTGWLGIPKGPETAQ